jgi:hypothetical protein
VSLLVICPSRGRPDKALEAYQAFVHHKCNSDTEMVFVLDDDDPTVSEYSVPNIVIPAGSNGMGAALNLGAAQFVDSYDTLGFIGDDHRFRTACWDTHIAATLEREGGGIAYGNDLLQGINLPTQVFISSSIVKTLGWMCLPGAKHLYLDNTWKVLGESLDRLYYLPEIIIEHLHPTGGKATWDENYQRVNAPEVYEHDSKVFAAWTNGSAVDDIERVRRVLA